MAELVEELEKLASLRDRGVLTGEEFEQQKAALLGAPGASGETVTANEPPAPAFPDFTPEEEAAMQGGYTPLSAPMPRKGGNKTLIIILAVAGGVFLLLIVVAVAVGGRHRSRPYYSGPTYYSSPYYRSPPRRYYSPPPSSSYSRPKRRYPH